MHISIEFLKKFLSFAIAMVPIWGILTVMVSLLGIWVGFLEGVGWKDGLYFGWITGTTVGYGDIIPTRWLSKILSVCIGIIGIINTGIMVTIAVHAGRATLLHSNIKDDVEKRINSSKAEKLRRRKNLKSQK